MYEFKLVLICVVVFTISFRYSTALECYVCDNQDDNKGKCVTTIQTCNYGEEVCLSEIRWGTTPYWQQGALKQYYISKRCATKDKCEKYRSSNMGSCTHIWYEDWKCSECCKGDRCNYYIIMPSRKKILQYGEENMTRALTAVRNGMAVATAARQYAVPKTTLWCKFHGKYPEQRKMGPTSFFSPDEESTLVNWIKLMARKRFPITKNNLIVCARRLAIELKKDNNDGRIKLGKKWFLGFMKRHPNISQRVSQNLTKSRKDVTEGQIRSWFLEVEEYLTSNNLFHILNDQSRVFNADESAFFLNPKGLKVLASRGDKSIYQAANNDEKECLTVLINCNAAGALAPPLIIFRYTRIPAVLAESVPKEWGIGRSESGWMTAEGFYEYVTNVFHPWLIKSNITLPVLLFLDGHSSHMSIHLSTFCSKNGIVLIALFPNATHLLQPLDVAVFKTLKAGWKEKVYSWKLENGNCELKRHNFAPILKEVLDERVTADILLNAFRKCGLTPWNAEAVAFEKTKNATQIQPNVFKSFVPNNKAAFETLEHYIGKEKLAAFTSSADVWDGDIQDASLFTIWKTIKNEMLINQSENMTQEINASVSVNIDDRSIEESTKGHLTNTEISKIEENNNTYIKEITSPDPDLERRVVLTHSTPLRSKELDILQSVMTEKSPEMLVPTPFKKALFWPEQKEEKSSVSKRKRQKIPTVITSQKWQDFNTKKKEEKEKLEKEKQERKQNRVKAKLEKEEKNQKKNRPLESSESSEESGEEVNFMESDESPWYEEEEAGCEYIDQFKNKKQLSQGSFVVVVFMGGKRLTQKFIYVCIVQDIKPDDVSVMALKCLDTAKKTFVADEKDISFVKFDQIVGLLNPPKIVTAGNRVRYVFNKPVLEINEK